jgi:hypothetical protein
MTLDEKVLIGKPAAPGDRPIEWSEGPALARALRDKVLGSTGLLPSTSGHQVIRRVRAINISLARWVKSIEDLTSRLDKNPKNFTDWILLSVHYGLFSYIQSVGGVAEQLIEANDIWPRFAVRAATRAIASHKELSGIELACARSLRAWARMGPRTWRGKRMRLALDESALVRVDLDEAIEAFLVSSTKPNRTGNVICPEILRLQMALAARTPGGAQEARELLKLIDGIGPAEAQQASDWFWGDAGLTGRQRNSVSKTIFSPAEIMRIGRG